MRLEELQTAAGEARVALNHHSSRISHGVGFKAGVEECMVYESGAIELRV